MKVKRGPLFETNSSSSHSITISPVEDSAKVKKQRFNLSPNGESITIFGGEFGWGPDRFTDPMTKANYAFTYAFYIAIEGRDYCPNGYYVDYKKKNFAMLKKVVEEKTGKKVFFPERVSDIYIDHQSSDVGSVLFEDEQTLSDFIFNSASVLTIDNDNNPAYA